MILKMQCAFAADSMLPRDRLVITPHFEIDTVLGEPQPLCDDLADALATWAGTAREVTVTAYDSQGAKPVYPAGTATVNTGAAPVSGVAREVACCLSFYADRNIPRHRGRLYIPPAITPWGTGVRPGDPLRTHIAELVPIFADLGGINVDWVVYSPTEDTARKVTHWWIDDEWDTIRSRGLRATGRLAGTTSG